LVNKTWASGNPARKKIVTINQFPKGVQKKCRIQEKKSAGTWIEHAATLTKMENQPL